VYFFVADKATKTLHTIFHDLGLKITAEVNNHIVNFLYVTLNLQEETFSPYRKPNNDPLYVDSRLNHPPSIIKHIPGAIITNEYPHYRSTKRHSTYPRLSTRTHYAVVITTRLYNTRLMKTVTIPHHQRRGGGKEKLYGSTRMLKRTLHVTSFN
jgi:hypothetical protein